jgi:amino acid permease
MHVASSPVRYMKKQIRPGGIKSSIFSLIILCLGAGTLSIPYVFYQNGLVFGTFLLLLGAFLSIYTGWLVVICCHKLDAQRYEDIAMATYGKKASVLTSICMLACLIGFVMSYIVLVSGIKSAQHVVYIVQGTASIHSAKTCQTSSTRLH